MLNNLLKQHELRRLRKMKIDNLTVTLKVDNGDVGELLHLIEELKNQQQRHIDNLESIDRQIIALMKIVNGIKTEVVK